MRPAYIFTAVFIVALFMAIGLPQLATAAPVSATAAMSADRSQPVVNQSPAEKVQSATPTQITRDQASAVPESSAAVQPADLTASNAAPVEKGRLGSEQDGIPLTSIAQVAPELQSFIDSVANNHPDQVVGVFVPGRFALPVLQQPVDDINYITPFDGALTQYAPPLDDNVVSLLAHNFLAGRVFFDLQVGDSVTLVYGDGHLAHYLVDTIDTYQALSPLDPYSDFIDQADLSGSLQTFLQVYDRYYRTSGQVVFQTCIEKNGDLSWGRIFVVARPLP